MPHRHCKTCMSPLHTDDTHAECVMLGEIPRWHCAQRDWLLPLREFQSCLSMLSDSFLFREQDARQWGSQSGFSLSQGPEKRDRPDSMRHQSHRPSHRAFYVQPGSVGAPALAHDDRDERGGQSSLPRRSGLVRQPVWTSCGVSEVISGKWHFLPKHTSSSSASSRPRPAPTQQIAKPTTTALEPQPPEGRRDRERSCSAQCYPFPKRQGPRPKIALDPAPQKSSWTARKKDEGPESRYRWTTAQAASILPLATPLSAGCRGKFVFGSPRAHFSTHVSDLFDSGQNITHTFSKREQKYFSAYHKRPALMQPVFTTV